MSLSVNGVPIPEESVAAEISRMRESYEHYVRENGAEPKDDELREWAEENLIEEEVFRQEAEKVLPTLDEDRVRQYAEALARQENAPASSDLTARAARELKAHALMKNIRRQVSRPREPDVRAYYDSHPEQFVRGEVVRLSHLCRFFYPANKSELFLDLLRIKSEVAGARLEWAAAVERFSDTFAQDGGLFDAVMAGELPKAVESQLFALAPGEMSDVVELGGRSLHVFRLLAKEPPASLALKEVRQPIADLLFDQACQAALETHLDALKVAAEIRRS